MLGKPDSWEEQQLLKWESEHFEDIIQGDFRDTYRNLTYKNLMGKLWVTKFCTQAEFVIKTDDDVFIDLYSVFAFTRKFLYTEVSIHDRFLIRVIFPYTPNVSYLEFFFIILISCLKDYLSGNLMLGPVKRARKVNRGGKW